MESDPATGAPSLGKRSGGISSWGPASVRGRLVILTLALLIPAILVGAAALRDAAARERRAIETQLGETARALSLGVDRQIGQDKALLAGLATSPLLRIGSWRAFDAQARAAAPPGVWIVVRAPDGQQLVNTRYGWGAPLPSTPNNPANLSWAVTEPEVRVSNVFTSVAGRPQIIVQRQLQTASGATIDIATSRFAGSLGAILEAQKLSDGWVGTLVDAKGVIIARSRNGDAYVGRSPPADMLAQLERADEGVFESRTIEGLPSVFAFSRAPESRWAVIVAMPKAEVTHAARRALLLAGLMGAALLAGGLLLAGWVAESVARPIEALASYADGLGGGATAERPRTRLREADLVGAALEESARKLNQREEELRRLNATLETRIADRTRELAETTESLIQAQKLEAVGRLTGGIAHDFNNLLTAIQGNLELLSRRVQDEKPASFVARARQAADRGVKLTAQLLAFSRRQRLEPEPVDLNGSVTSATQLLTSTLGGTIRVETALAEPLPFALADATQLELIILNLAINARDAMPGGGLLTISTGARTVTETSDRPESPPVGEYVVLCVSDNGAGMSPEIRARVFEPFFTTKEVGRGSGLGLPQVLGVAKQLGGGVELTTQLGKGTTVTVYLPIAAEIAPRPPAPVDAATPEKLRGLCILLVDDDPDVRGVAASILRELGCRVVDAASGIEAIGSLAGGIAPDAAVLDYAMPGLNGVQTATKLREARPGLPILLMSGYADAATLAETWQGAFLHKPFSSGGLAAQLSRLVAQREASAPAA